MRLYDHPEPTSSPRRRTVVDLLFGAALALSTAVVAPTSYAAGVVAGIDNAPIVADGTTSGRATPSFAIASPVVGVPTARLTVFFTAGDTADEYVLRFRLFGGNAVESVVLAQ